MNKGGNLAVAAFIMCSREHLGLLYIKNKLLDIKVGFINSLCQICEIFSESKCKNLEGVMRA